MPATAKPRTETIQLPPAMLLAAIQPGTFDAKAKTFVVVLQTGAIMQRYSWARDEVFELQLDMSGEACDLSRLNSGTSPFLLDHNAWSVSDSVAGVFTRAWMEGGKLLGEVRASGRPEFASILQGIEEGTLRNVSVGTDILATKDVTPPDAKMRRLLATSWRPFEGSLVAIGADPGAVVLSRERRTTPCTILLSSEAMPDEIDPTKTARETAERLAKEEADRKARETAERAAADTQAAERARADERGRVLEIQRLGAKLKLDPAVTAKFVTDGTSITAAKTAMLDQLAAADQKTPTEQRVGVGREEGDGVTAAMEAALLHRSNPEKFKLENTRGREYVGLSMVELARECLRLRGLDHRGMDRMRLVTAALQSTSDFPEILANVATKTLRNAYMLAPQTWRTWVRIVPAADFKQMSSVNLSDAPKLLELTEHGEIQTGAFTDNAEKYSLKTYARKTGITRQAIINDDLGALTRIPEAYGFQAASLVSDLVYGVLTANANMSDGIALFESGTHKNLGVKKLTQAGAKEMRAAMRIQTGPGGTVLNVAPRYVIAPAALEQEALQLLLAEITAATTGNANVYRGTMVPVIEARLDANSTAKWYGASDPAQMDGMQVSFLEGQGDGPRIESRAGWEVEGVEIKVVMDAAAKAVEFRGLWSSAGTTD
jgi:hypothetical protein